MLQVFVNCKTVLLCSKYQQVAKLFSVGPFVNHREQRFFGSADSCVHKETVEVF